MTSINNELNNDFLPSILNIPRIKPYREEHSKLIKEKLMQDNIKIYQSDDENLQKEERAVYVGSFLLYDEKNNIKVSVPCYRENKKTWELIPSTDKMQISQGIRGRSINEGMQMESMTIEEWLKSVEELI